MRIGQDKLPPAIDLGRAVPDGGICRPRAKGELREPPDEVRREVVAMLQACSAPGRKGCETPFAQVVTALGPWWKRNQDSTLPEVLADLIAPRGTARQASAGTSASSGAKNRGTGFLAPSTTSARASRG